MPLKSGTAIPPQAREVFSLPCEISFIFSRVHLKLLLFSFSACVPQQQNKGLIEYECFVKPQPHCKTKEPHHHYIKILVLTLAQPQLLFHSVCNLFPLEAGNPPKLSAPTQGPQLHPSPRIYFFPCLWALCRIYNQLSSSCTGDWTAFSSASFPNANTAYEGELRFSTSTVLRCSL